jgi:hypothetical protein
MNKFWPRYTELIFVEPGVKHMLPAIRHLAGDVFVFQQDSAPAHRARTTLEYLRQATPDFISPDLWPPNSPDLNPVEIWGCLQERMYQQRVRDVDQLKQRLVEVWSDLQQTVVDAAIGELNGGRDSEPASVRKDIILNICFNCLRCLLSVRRIQ